MAGGAALPASRRRSLAGESGWVIIVPFAVFWPVAKFFGSQKGLVRNRRVFAIAVFASLGGL